jgi:mannose-6-phosphate isomerase-like protein (cupin superfamily)
MRATVTRGGGPLDVDEALRAVRDARNPHAWANPPGDVYARHEHPYHKVLFCVAGSITFHVEGSDFELSAGDRLDLPPHTPHAATVGPDGVRCVEGVR